MHICSKYYINKFFYLIYLTSDFLLQVINVLTSSRELIELLKNVDIVFHSKQAGSGKSLLNSLCKFVPSIHEQLQVNYPLPFIPVVFPFSGNFVGEKTTI